MAITEVLEALGTFEFEIQGAVPREILDAIDYFGHIAIVPGRIEPEQYGDGTLDAARYVGVIRGKKLADDGRTNLIMDDTRISGVGMNFWLGDDDGKGAVIEEALEFTTDTFSTVITALRPDSLSAGTIYSVSGSYSGRHVYETPRTAIKYVCDTMSTLGVTVYDTFNRGDSTSSLGNLDSSTVDVPHTWVQNAGTWGINSNSAYISAAAMSVATVPVFASFDAQVTVQTISSGGAWLIFRYSDANNYWRFGSATATGVILLQKVVAGSATTVATLTETMANSTTLRVQCSADNIYGYVNGVLWSNLIDTFNNTATNIGMRCDTTSTRFETFNANPEFSPISWRVNNDGSLDAGPETSLYQTTPKCVIVRKGISFGEDLTIRAIPTVLDLEQDMEDFSTRTVMLAESDGESLATGSADIDHVSPGTNTYKDLQGNPLQLTRMVSESDTLEQNADVRAELALRQVIEQRRNLTVSTEDYDVYGSFNVGDYIYLYDPDAGIVDITNELTIRGSRINPMKLQVTEQDWPITSSYSVCLRTTNGVWHNLTDYVKFDDPSATRVTIGDFQRTLAESAQNVADRLSHLTTPDMSIPGQVAWITSSFQTTAYIDVNGNVHSQQKIAWATPSNTNATTITDGDHYEVQYKLNTGHLYTQTWGAVSTLTWSQMNTWGQPVAPDSSPYQTLNVPWGETSTVITGLATGTAYDVRIRAVDTGNNQGAWSAVETFITQVDNIPPSAPAAPEVASSVLAVQVVSSMGKASGGTFNLETDLAFFEVHAEYEPLFTPSATTSIGQLKANKGMMNAGTPTVGTFDVSSTVDVYIKLVAVDTSGNRSSPSAAASATAALIDDEHISNLTVSKITAGTISSDWLLGATIRTATTGARLELDMNGLRSYDADNIQTVNLDNLTGSVDLKGSVTSLNYEEGLTGWRIGSEGTNQFESVNSLGTVAGTDGYFNKLYMEGIAVPSQADLEAFYEVRFPCVKGRITQPVSAPAASIYAALDFDTKVFERNVSTANSMLNLSTNPSRLVAPQDGVYNISYLFQFTNVNDGAAPQHHTTVIATLNGGGTLPITGSPNSTWVLEEKDTAYSNTRSTNRASFDLEMNAGDYVEFFCSNTNALNAPLEIARGEGTAIASMKMVASTTGTTWVTDSGGVPEGAKSKSYVAVIGKNYKGSGAERDDPQPNRCYQGQFDSTYASQKSMVRFTNDGSIQSALSGKTIVGCELAFKVQSSYSGYLHAIIGTHTNSLLPSTFINTNTGRVQYSYAYTGGTYVADLGATIGQEFQDGTNYGITFGPGPSSNKVYYGYMYGAGSSYIPTITFYYLD